jgi:hypothetical protein
MTYHDSLWKDAPVGATHWGDNGWVKDLVEHQGTSAWWQYVGLEWTCLVSKTPPIFHPRPLAYTPAAQLVDQYRKEHGKEIEVDAGSAFKAWGDTMELDSLMFDAAFHLALLERYLAAERARVEGEVK